MKLINVDFSRVRVMTFDAGGTLVKPSPGVGIIYAEILGKHGVVVAPEILEQRFRKIFKELAARRPRPMVSEETERKFWRAVVRRCVTPECAEEKVGVVFEELWEEFALGRRWIIRAGMAQMLEEYAAKPGVRLAVLSNWDSRLHRVLEGLDLRRYFAKVFISSEIGAEKPDLRAFRAVEAAMGQPPEAFLHIGDDAAHDYAAARAAGWQAILTGGL